ncbi:hypothetical protein QE418_000395 [Microbacterium testaceum]|uniref:hypothetical protein n=1 Tax=Microbacterium TaxID=33882 RepID=UPI00278AD4CC|nr:MULTISPECIES: hypothetical protein [Microbacterium]MDQ1110947.1 hypothetical protein [Microbacterium testaceum]MDR6098512.1 hypothetical protein [Microbacterium sp. SORGH_AS_0454]
MTSHSPSTASNPGPRHGTPFFVSLATIVVGTCVLAGAVVSAGVSAAATLRDNGPAYAASETSTTGLTALDVDVAGGSLTIAYGDVSEAQLDVDGGGTGDWTFERDGTTLRVSSPRTNVVGWSNPAGSATLLLPRLSTTTNLDARIEVAGGALRLDADFTSLSVQLAGGDVDLAGDVRTLSVSVSGGAASGTLTGVGDATLEVAGGSLATTLKGDAPARTKVTVTAGSADITLPDDEYNVTTDSGLGRVDNGLRTSNSATAVVDVEATLGQVSMRS